MSKQLRAPHDVQTARTLLSNASDMREFMTRQSDSMSDTATSCPTEVPMFETVRLPTTVLETVARYAARATWPAGFPIYQRGAVADGIFIVVRGSVVLRSRVKS